jgi:hypothetical protein
METVEVGGVSKSNENLVPSTGSLQPAPTVARGLLNASALGVLAVGLSTGCGQYESYNDRPSFSTISAIEAERGITVPELEARYASINFLREQSIAADKALMELQNGAKEGGASWLAEHPGQRIKILESLQSAGRSLRNIKDDPRFSAVQPQIMGLIEMLSAAQEHVIARPTSPNLTLLQQHSMQARQGLIEFIQAMTQDQSHLAVGLQLHRYVQIATSANQAGSALSSWSSGVKSFGVNWPSMAGAQLETVRSNVANLGAALEGSITLTNVPSSFSSALAKARIAQSDVAIVLQTGSSNTLSAGAISNSLPIVERAAKDIALVRDQATQLVTDLDPDGRQFRSGGSFYPWLLYHNLASGGSSSSSSRSSFSNGRPGGFGHSATHSSGS